MGKFGESWGLEGMRKLCLVWSREEDLFSPPGPRRPILLRQMKLFSLLIYIHERYQYLYS